MEDKCKYWPEEDEDHSGVCGVGSEVGGSHICTGSDEMKCQWAIAEKKGNK